MGEIRSRFLRADVGRFFPTQFPLRCERNRNPQAVRNIKSVITYNYLKLKRKQTSNEFLVILRLSCDTESETRSVL